MPRSLSPRVERVLGRPDRFRLALQGVSFDLTKADLLALAGSLQRVLESVAKDEQPQAY